MLSCEANASVDQQLTCPMPISGLVVTLRNPLQNGGATVRCLEADGRFTCGAPIGARLPLVLEAEDDHAARQAHDWLHSLPGVAHIDVAFVGFENP
jgi:hypothetical protein